MEDEAAAEQSSQSRRVCFCLEQIKGFQDRKCQVSV
jgi:hypothetical protein